MRDPSAKELELLGRQVDRHQEIVKRLAGNGVQVKTWCATVVAAVAALAATDDKPELLGLALVVAMGFLFMDGYYLYLERHFRDASDRLVDAVSSADEPHPWTAFFRFEAPEGVASWKPILRCCLSLAISPFYAVIAIALVVGLGVSL